MGRIKSNGDWVGQHRKNQGQFLEKQDIESYLFNKQLTNGNNVQGKNTLNTDDLLNIPALDYEPISFSKQNSIEFIDGGKAHTPATQAFLTALTTLSAISPNIAALSKKAISTDNQNSLSSTVKNFTEIRETPVLFDTTSAITPTSQNHHKSKGSTKHSEIKLAKEQKVSDQQSQLNDDHSLIREKRAVAEGHIILQGNKLTFSYASLDTEILKQTLKDHSDITELCLWGVEIDPQKAQEIGKILKGTKVKVLSLAHNKIGTKGAAIDFGTMLADTEVTEVNLAYNGIGDKRAIGLIKSLKNTKVKVVNLAGNNISDQGANDLIPELTGTQIIEVKLLYKNLKIKPETYGKILKVLEHNRHISEESHIEAITSTVESNTSEKEPATSPNIDGKRVKRDLDTASTTEKSSTTEQDEETPTMVGTTFSTEGVATIEEDTTTPTVMVTTSSTEDSTTTEQGTTTIREETTTPTMMGTTFSTEGATTTEQGTTTIEENPTTPTVMVTTSSTEDATTTEQETTDSTTEKSSTSTTIGYIAFSAENPNTKESTPNDPTSSTIPIGLPFLGLIVAGVAAIGAVGGVIIKKFCGGHVNRSGHDTLALAGLPSDSHVDNNEDTHVTGATTHFVDI